VHLPAGQLEVLPLSDAIIPKLAQEGAHHNLKVRPPHPDRPPLPPEYSPSGSGPSLNCVTGRGSAFGLSWRGRRRSEPLEVDLVDRGGKYHI
jgi:hypothetical protein